MGYPFAWLSRAGAGEPELEARSMKAEPLAAPSFETPLPDIGRSIRRPEVPAEPGGPVPSASPRAARLSRAGTSATAYLLICLAWTWCLALCAHVPKETATTALAVTYGVLFLLFLPFHRWACFLVVVSACGTEVAMRSWSPMRYNTVHYATMVLLPVSYILVRPRTRMPKALVFWFTMS